MQVQSNANLLAYLTKSDAPQLKVGQRLPVQVVSVNPGSQEGTIRLGGQEVNARLDIAARPGDQFWVSVRDLSENGLILTRGPAITSELKEIPLERLMTMLARGVALDSEIAEILGKFQSNPQQMLDALRTALGSLQSPQLQTIVQQLLQAVPQWENLSSADILRYFNLLGMKYENQLLEQFLGAGRADSKFTTDGQGGDGLRGELLKLLSKSGDNLTTAERAQVEQSLSQLQQGRENAALKQLLEGQNPANQAKNAESASAQTGQQAQTAQQAQQSQANQQAQTAQQAQGQNAGQAQPGNAQTPNTQQLPAGQQSATQQGPSAQQATARQTPAGSSAAAPTGPAVAGPNAGPASALAQATPGQGATANAATNASTVANADVRASLATLTAREGANPSAAQAGRIAGESENIKAQLLKLLEATGKDMKQGERGLVRNLLDNITAQQLWLQSGVRKNAFVLMHLPLQDQEGLREARIAIESARKGNKMDETHCRIAVQVDTVHLGPVGADIWIYEDSINLNLLSEDPEGLAEVVSEVLTSTQEHFQAMGWFLTSVTSKKFEDMPHFSRFLSGEQQMEINVVG